MRPPSKETSTAIRLVGGKGGAGKTTCAAAQAVAAASRGERTLLLSTDPAPSLGDVFGVRIGASRRRIRLQRGLLDAVAVNPHTAFARWLRRRKPALEAVAIRGTWLDRSDVQSLLNLSLPGLDEVASLLEVFRYERSGDYDVVIVDTAPTGHTLRMLAMPEMLAGIAGVFDRMQEKHRAIVAALGRNPFADEADAVVRELQDDARAMGEFLRNPSLAEISLVTLPEMLSIEETLDAALHFERQGIPLAKVIVNRLTDRPPDSCAWCETKRRFERGAVSALVDGLEPLRQNPRIAGVAARDDEPIGIRALSRLAPELDRQLVGKPRTKTSRTRVARRVAKLSESSHYEAFDTTVKLLMFGGKGGVGKTTCAAAEALHVASKHPKRRVLLVSTDPAHSLGDALAVPLSDSAQQVPGAPGNLEARELDADRALESLRREYAASIDALFNRISGGSSFDLSHDRRVMHDLLDLAPPGLDEVAAVISVVDLLGGADSLPRYDTIVVDTAPTGHALRLLETPATVQDWTKALMTIVLKYQPVMGVGDLGAALLRLSRGLTRLRTVLKNPNEAKFMIVTRPGTVPSAETRRLQASLRRLKVRVPALIVNAAGAGECRRCRRTIRREREEIASLAQSARRLPIVLTPAVVPPPVGIEALLDWRDQWRRQDRR